MSQSRNLLFLNPRRAWLYSKLERVMDRIEGGRLPMHVTDVYLFGSFLLEKENPNDLDILIIYDSDLTLQQYETSERTAQPHWQMQALRRSPARLRALLKRNAERSLDICICPSIEEFQRDLKYPMPFYLKIWSRDDDDWRTRLACHFSGLSAAGRPLEPGCPA
jgi:hypothetical protein